MLRALEKDSLPQFIVLCNELTGVKTTALVQRIRTEVSANIPIVVMADRISKAERSIFEEMNVSQFIQLSLERDTFLKNVLNAYRSDRFGGSPLALMRKVRQALRTGSKIEASHAMSLMAAHVQATESELAYVESEILFSEGDFAGAKAKAMLAIKGLGQPFMALDLLGRIFIRMGDLQSAQVCLTKAQEVSPLHVDRLCEIAQLHASGGKADEAMAFLERAKLLDPTRVGTFAQESELALDMGSSEHVKKIFSSFAQLEDLVAMLNNRGVALVLMGRFEEGLAFYQNVLSVIPEDRADLRARVQFNLGLGFARCKKFKESLATLEKIDSQNIGKLSGKVGALKGRVADALAKGGTLVFISELNTKEASGAISETEENLKHDLKDINLVNLDDELRDRVLNARRMGRCCAGIFQPPYKASIESWNTLAESISLRMGKN